MSNIRVALRVRPLSEKEKDDGSQEIVKVNGNSVRIENVKVLGIQEFGDTRARIREFVFDHCYDCMHGDTALSSQVKVFEDLGTEVLKAAFDGFNACVFAYGQTGTGKTHTMMGYPGDVGLIPRICEGLFTHMSECTDENVTSRIDISYFEIYNERVRDLLQPELLKINENYSLKIREHPKEGPYVKDLSWHRVKNNEDIQALLNKGNEYRVTAETYMHGHSSRSHAIVTVCYTQARLEENRPSEIVSKINLVDLAGSERADPSSRPDFRKRLTEGANINKSLVTLGYVIKTLAERSLLSWATEETGSIQSFQSSAGGESSTGSSPSVTNKQRVPYIPYRDSVLTWLLKDSLGGNSKTIMIATITPASQYYSESISTLRYAQRAKNIINKPRVNEDSNVAIIKQLRQEIERLHEMLANAQMPAPQLGANCLPGDIIYFVPSLHRGREGPDDQGGNLVTLPESEDSIIAEKLHENEEMAKQLTQSWMCKWSSTHDIMKESDLSIRGLRNRSSSMGVMIDSQLPYLVGMDDDVLSTGVVIFHLKEGDTLVGREDADIPQDIVLHGPAIQKDHCVIRHLNGEVYLHPCPGAMCTVGDLECTEPTKLTQGDYVVLGGNQVFRFNNPSEAAKLRENRRSQGSLNTLNTSHLSFGGLSRASSYSSIGGDDSNFLSPHSQLGRSYPNSRRRHSDIIIYAASDLCRDLEKRYKTEQERIEETKRELEKLKAEHEKAEELRQLKEEEMYQMHEQHRADIEEQKRLLARQIEENERARAMAEEELQLARESLSKEKEAFQKQLEEERKNLKELQKIEQQQESMAIQTDPLSTQSMSVGSEPLSTQTASIGSEPSVTCETSTGADEDYMADLPVRYKGGRKMSASDQLEELAQTEFSRRMSYRETEESLAIQQEDIEDAYLQTKEQIQERLSKIHKMEEEYKEIDKAHLQEIAAQSEKVQEIQKKEVQLEVYIQENEELINVGREKPHPLRSACSEMFLLDPSIEDQEYSQKTTSLLDIQGEVSEDQEQISPRSRPLRRSSSAESLESGISERSKDMDDDKKINQKAKKISSVAKDVTSRLYQAPEPKFKYVPKTKEKDIKTVPRTKTYRNSDAKSRASPTKAVRDIDRSKSESPQRVTSKRTSQPPNRDIDPKRRSASAPQRDPKSKVGPGPKSTNKTADKQDKNDSKVMAVRNKTQGPNRTVSPTSRLGGTVSPERLSVIGPSIVRTSTSSLRQMASATSLASVPESLAESEEQGVNESHNEQDISTYVVKKRQKKGRSNFIDDDFRCHSAPDSQRMSQALDDYTGQMDYKVCAPSSDRNDPLITSSVSVDDSDMYREEEHVTQDLDNYEEMEINATSNVKENVEQTESDIEIKETAELNEPSVNMYISSGEETKCIDDTELYEERENEIEKVSDDNSDSSEKCENTNIMEVSESTTIIDDTEVNYEPHESETTETAVLGKRDRPNTDTPINTDVPTKRAKESRSSLHDSKISDGAVKNGSEVEFDNSCEIENFSEDSLDLNISIDSLDGETQMNRLTQSLPAYLIRSEKPMSDESLNDSLDAQSKDSLDSEKSNEGTNVILHTSQLNFSASLPSSGIQCHVNKETPTVIKKPTLTKVSQEAFAFFPSESLLSTDIFTTDSGQIKENDSDILLPQDEESTSSLSHQNIERLDTQAETDPVHDENIDTTKLMNEKIPVEHLLSGENQYSCRGSESYYINGNVTSSKDLTETKMEDESCDKITPDVAKIKSFVSDIIHHAQEICLEVSKTNPVFSSDNDIHEKPLEQNEESTYEASFVQEYSQDVIKDTEKEDLNEYPEIRGEDALNGNENVYKPETNDFVSQAPLEGLNVVVANICNEMLEDDNVVNNAPSQKDNEVNQKNELKSTSACTESDVTQDIEILDDVGVIESNKDIEMDRYEEEKNRASVSDKQENNFASDAKGKDSKCSDKVSKKQDPLVDENHNVVETEVEEESAGEKSPELDQNLNLEKTYTKDSETSPVRLTDKNNDLKGRMNDKEESGESVKKVSPIGKEFFPEDEPLKMKKLSEEKSGEDTVTESENDIMPSDSSEPAQFTDRADNAHVSSPLMATRTIGVGTSQELLDSLDDHTMGDNVSQGSNDSFLLDPKEELQVLQEALEKLPAKQTTGPQLSNAQRATRKRAMNRHRGADSDGVAQLSDEATLPGTQTKITSRPSSGSRRRKRPASKATDKSARHLNNRSSDDYDSSENDSVYSDDSIDIVRPGNHLADGHNGHIFTNEESNDLVFFEKPETAEMLSRPKQKQHSHTSPCQPHRQDFTEVVDGPDGRRTVGIQTLDHSLRYRSTGSTRTDMSDFDGSFVSEGRGMVMSPLSLWNSNERSGSESLSDKNSTSSGFIKNLNDLDRSMPATPRSSTRSNTSAFSEKSNLQKGPTEVWSSSSSELRPLPSFRDDLSYVMETEAMSPGHSSLDYTEDAQSQYSSVYMRTPQEGERLIPRPECSTPTSSARDVTISFPESQLQQTANLDVETPVKFQVTVHENNTNIEYNVEKTEYKTYALRHRNEPNIIPDRILVNMTENVNSQTLENYSTQHREEITIHQPDTDRSQDDILIVEKSYRSSSSSEREIEMDNDVLKKDELKEHKDTTEEKSYHRIPGVAKKKELKLQHSGVVEATNYPGTTTVAETGSLPDETRTAEEGIGASLSESEYTSDYGTITSVDGRMGFMSFTSDSEDSESLAVSPRPSVVLLPEQGKTGNQGDNQDMKFLPLQNEIREECHDALSIPEKGHSICSMADTDGNVAVAGTQEISAISAQVVNHMSSAQVPHHSGDKNIKEVDTEASNDIGYGSMKQDVYDDHEGKKVQIEEEMETDSSSVDTVKQIKTGENQNFCSQETLDDVTNLTGSHENVKVPELDLSQSPVCSPQRQRKPSCSSTDDTYMSMDQSETNTSTSSSDYRTPQQSPRDVSQEVLSKDVDDVVIPDYCDELSQSTPRQKADEISHDQPPVFTSSPKQSSDVRTVSVNTESVSSATLSTPPASSKVKHIFDSSSDHTEAFRKDLEKKIAKLQRHIRSKSDSAISSDFTDGDSSSVSPRGSHVYDDKTFLGEKRLSKVFRTTQSPTRVRQTLNFEGSPAKKLPFKDSGNVFDDDDDHHDQDGKETFKESVAFGESNFLPIASPTGVFPERLIDALLAIKPQPLRKCHSLDSLSAIINVKPHLSRAVRGFQSVEDISDNSKSVETMEASENIKTGTDMLMSSDGARPLSPGEIGMDQDSLDGMYSEIEKENIVPDVNLPAHAGPNMRISEKSTSLSILGDNLPEREYHRSLSEGNIDDFDQDNSNLDSSNDSITFVFIKDDRTKSPKEDKNEMLYGEECYDPCGSGELYDSESQSPDSRQMSSPGEYSDRDQNDVVNISGRGHPSQDSEDKISDVLSLSESEESVIEYNQDRYPEEEQFSDASEEIKEIICQNLEQIHGSRELGISCQTDSPPTYTDTSDSFVQGRGKHYDDDSEPLRHKFGIDESVLPIPERSVSADNIPKHLMPLKEIMRSRSTGMLDVGVADEQESESGIFPPALKTDDDATEQSVSLNTMSEGGLDHISQRTFSDVEPSLSNHTSGDVDSENTNSEENSSAVVRSICSKSSSVESLEEEFTIDFKTNWKKHEHSHSASSEGEIEQDALADEQEQIRKVLETVQRLIMPKPTTVDRGMTTDSETGSNLVSIGVQAPSSPTNIPQVENIIQPDQIILPALAAPFRAQSMDSFGLGANGQGMEFSEGSRNWCTLGELMIETTHLLRRINERLPEQDRKGSVSSSEESQASEVILKKWQEISIQTGLSSENITSVGSQTDGDATVIENDAEEKHMCSESTQVDRKFKLKSLDICNTDIYEVMPFTACEADVQTDETADINQDQQHSYDIHHIEDKQDSVLTQTVAPVSLSQSEPQSCDRDQTEPTKVSLQNQTSSTTTAKFIPQVKAELGLDQNNTKDLEVLSKANSPERRKVTSALSVQSPSTLLPGFTLPDTPEIVELRKEHAKLMENLRKASDDRSNRKGKLQARKKAVPDSNLKGDSFTQPLTMLQSQKNENPVLSNVKQKSKIRKTNKNDPETESASSDSSFVDDIVRSDCEDIESFSEKGPGSDDVVRSDVDDKAPSLDGNTQDIIRSDGEDKEVSSENEKICDAEDDKEPTREQSEGSQSPLSTQEFVQISIQVDPNTGVTVENKTYREKSPVRKSGQIKEKNLNAKEATIHMKEEHTWALAGDEFKASWERRPESSSRRESNTSQDTDSHIDDKDELNEVIDDVMEDIPIEQIGIGPIKQAQESVDEKLRKSRSDSEESLNSIIEETVVPQSYSRDQSEPKFSGKKLPNGKSSEEKRDKDAYPYRILPTATECLEETIVPQIYKREHKISPSVFDDSSKTPDEVEPESVSDDDPRERGPNLPQQIIKCETSPKYKAHILREQQRLTSGPDFTDSTELIPHYTSKDSEERSIKTHRPESDVFKLNKMKPQSKVIKEKLQYGETDSREEEVKLDDPNREKPDEVSSLAGDKKKSRPVLLADDATQISVEFSDDCTQTDLDSQMENTILPQAETKTNTSPKNRKPGNIKESVEETAESSDTKLPKDIREELESLQQERQHIMDLLGLSYLPNSLTVELLEAKLNHCIGQTDLLLENLENSIDPEEIKKTAPEQKQAKDYISKYRADLKKSKEDIKECREQLNKGRGRGQGSGRGRTPFRRRDFYSQQRQAEIDAFKLERMREQQDYERSGHAYSSKHATPSKSNTPLKGNTPLRGNTPLYGNSPSATPRSDRSRSSSPSYSPGYMNPKEHKAHLVDLRRQLIKDVVEEERQNSRSCSPSLQTSPPPVPKHRSPSEQSLGFSPKVSVSLSDVPGSPSSSSPSSPGSKTYIVAPGSSSLSPVRRPGSSDPACRLPGSPYGSYQSSPDRGSIGRRTSPATLDRKMMAESIFSPQESEQILHEIEQIKKRQPSISAPMEELLRRSSFSSSGSQRPLLRYMTLFSSTFRKSSLRQDVPNISPRSQSDPRLPGRHITSPVARQLTNPLSLNLDCLQDDETGPYSPYSAYAREHLIPCERSPPGGVLRGTYELYHDRSDTSSVLSYDSDTFSDPGHRPRHNTLDEDTIKRLRPIRAEDIKARINRHKR